MYDFTPGTPAGLDDLKIGAFFLLDVGPRFTPAVLVADEDARFVLDLDYDRGNGQREFRLVSAPELNGRPILSISEARIVPSLAPDHLRSGRPHDYQDAKVLYVRPGALVVYAQAKRSPKTVNLTAGTLFGESLERGMHTMRWQITCPTVQGGVQVLHEIAL